MINTDTNATPPAIGAYEDAVLALSIAETCYRSRLLAEFSLSRGKVRRRSIRRLRGPWDELADAVVRYQHARFAALAWCDASGDEWSSVWRRSSVLRKLELDFVAFGEVGSDEELDSLVNKRMDKRH